MDWWMTLLVVWAAMYAYGQFNVTGLIRSATGFGSAG